MPGMACIEAFVYPTENKDKVLKAMQTLTSVEPEETSAPMDFGGKMLILSSCTRDDKEIQALRDKLGGLVDSSKREETVMLNKQRAFLGEIVPGKGLKITIRTQKAF
jgi:predicted RNA binding protein with dsRBD fold (UPF0201 family)